MRVKCEAGILGVGCAEAISSEGMLDEVQLTIVCCACVRCVSGMRSACAPGQSGSEVARRRNALREPPPVLLI